VKAARILQLVILLAVIAYLFLLHNANQAQGNLRLPFFLSFPPAVVIALALALGWVFGWLPARLELWRKERRLRKLEARVAELEGRPYPGAALSESEPVIPDRTGVFQTPKHSPDYENF
jgi:uncharacterized membrane protein YciS (DUF1049 family)